MTTEDYKSTRLYRIEETLNKITSGIYKISLHSVKCKTAMTAAAKLRENPEYNKPFGMWFEDTASGGANHAALPSTIGMWFKEGSRFALSLKANWKTPSDLIIDIAAAAKEWNAKVKEINVKAAERNSEATTAILKRDDTKTKEYPLYSNWNNASEAISQPDMDFLYNHLRRDELNNLYWLFDDGTVVLIPISEGSSARKILDDADFWSAFTKENMSKIADYSKAIIDRCYELRDSMLSSDEEIASLENELENIVPHCISRNISVQIIFVKVGQGKESNWVFDHFSLAMNAPNKAMNRTNWCRVLQTDMIMFLDFSRIALIRQWSNSENDNAIYKFTMKPVVRPNRKCPMLPPTFARFFKGKLINPSMGLLRIAAFIDSVIDQNNYSRQALAIVGNGKEGKGVFCKFLEHLFGSATVTLQENAFDRENRFGMMPAVNKRLVILQDIKKPTDVIESPMFKSITGNDTLSIDRKFQMPMEWRVRGTKIVLVTNKNIWLNSVYATTRVLPLFFKKNYNDTEAEGVNELVDKMLVEKEAFVQWCYDYIEWCRGLMNNKKERFPYFTKNGLIILSDPSFKLWFAGNMEIRNEQLIAEAFESETPENALESVFKVKKFEDDTEETNDVMQKIFDRFFIQAPDSKLRSSDISLRLIEGAAEEYPEMLLAGITKFSVANGRCTAIRNFKTWLSLNGVQKKRVNGTDFFVDIAIREDAHENLKQVVKHGNQEPQHDFVGIGSMLTKGADDAGIA